MVDRFHIPLKASDLEKPIEIADRTWWVGHYLPNDPFQCHVYLVENGDQSVLIDPGSVLTFRHTFQKIESVTSFNNIQYFVCHHQDPDITGALPLVDQIVSRQDAVIISHWRAMALLKHLDLKLPLLCAEKNGWQLELEDRRLNFIFTPYLHFPGAFCTFDPHSGVLFSSDLFGGFTEGCKLFARDESHFESIRPFHEHYMPAREILYSGLTKLEQFPVQMIAPQHGSIIPGFLVDFMFNQLKNIDCGLLLMARSNTDVFRLSLLNRLLRNFLDTLVLHREFSEIAQTLSKQAREILPVKQLDFYALTTEGDILQLSAESMYRGIVAVPPLEFRTAIGLDRRQWWERYEDGLIKRPGVSSGDVSGETPRGPQLVIPLFTPKNQTVHALAIFQLDEDIDLDDDTRHLLVQMSLPLSVAVEREIIQRTLDMQKQRFYEQAIRDSLTGLYTRIYMLEATKRLFAIHDRDPHAAVSIIIFDIDHFKGVNDRYGHNAGDEVLRRVGEVILRETRDSDIQVRIGGEEFAVFVVEADPDLAVKIAERVRQGVENLDLSNLMDDRGRVSISGGIAQRRQKESLRNALQRADNALYEAKGAGRNRICIAQN